MNPRRLFLLPVLLGVSMALARPAQGAAPAVPRGQSVSVVVQSATSGHVRVYVLQDGHMVPVGSVVGTETETFSIPQTFVQSARKIQLIADAIGSSDWYESDPVAIHPGSEVHFTIATHLDGSSVSVTG